MLHNAMLQPLHASLLLLQPLKGIVFPLTGQKQYLPCWLYTSAEQSNLHTKSTRCNLWPVGLDPVSANSAAQQQ